MNNNRFGSGTHLCGGGAGSSKVGKLSGGGSGSTVEISGAKSTFFPGFLENILPDLLQDKIQES